MNRIAKLQKAFGRKDVAQVKKHHTKKAIQDHLDHPDEHQEAGKYLPEAVYGASDGIVTTFAIVSGVIGADLSTSIVLILGFSNLIADGLSMAAGNYLSIKSEIDYHQLEYERENWEIDNYPKGEVEEIRQIYQAKGFKGKDLERAVDIITSNKKRWIETMMIEELGLAPINKSPFKAALVTFLSFLICGFIPLVTFVLIHFFPHVQIHPFLFASILMAVTIFIVGALRSLIIAKKWWKAGLEMLVIAGTAAVVAYGIGYFLKGLA